MCTSIIEIARAEGMAKRGDEWFPLSQAVVAYDHARHAPLGDVITLDFINTGLDPGARAGIELTLETARELRAAFPSGVATVRQLAMLGVPQRTAYQRCLEGGPWPLSRSPVPEKPWSASIAASSSRSATASPIWRLERSCTRSRSAP